MPQSSRRFEARAVVPPVLPALESGVTEVLRVLDACGLIPFVGDGLPHAHLQRRGVDLPNLLTLTVQVLLALFARIVGLALATTVAAAGMLLVERRYVAGILGDQRGAVPPHERGRGRESVGSGL